MDEANEKTMKRSALVLTLIVFFLVVVTHSVWAQAFKSGSEPDGFRGLKWGQKSSDIPGLVLLMVYDDEMFLYERRSDKLKIGTADLDKLWYWFFQDKLCMIEVESKGLSNWNVLREAIFEKFGRGYQEKEKLEGKLTKYYWEGTKTAMYLEYSVISEQL